MADHVESLAQIKGHQDRTIRRFLLVKTIGDRAGELKGGRNSGMEGAETVLVGRFGQVSGEDGGHSQGS